MRNVAKCVFTAVVLVFWCLFSSELASAAELRIVVVADNHYSISDGDSPECGYCEVTHKCLDRIIGSIENEIKPDAVMFLGDAVLGEGATKLNEKQTLELNQLFKSIADKRLTRPYLHVWGNHDGPNFPKVFGAGNRSEVMGGYNLLLMAIDYNNWTAGMGKFSAWKTVDTSVRDNSDKATLAFIHTPIVPPTFNNAFQTKKYLEKYPQVKIVFQGHVHAERLVVSKGVLYATLDQAVKSPFFPFYEVILNDNHVRIVRYDLKDEKYSGTTVWDANMDEMKDKNM